MAGFAVILCLENTYDHYTVVSGCSPSRFYFRDSDANYEYFNTLKKQGTLPRPVDILELGGLVSISSLKLMPIAEKFG